MNFWLIYELIDLLNYLLNNFIIFKMNYWFISELFDLLNYLIILLILKWICIFDID